MCYGKPHRWKKIPFDNKYSISCLGKIRKLGQEIVIPTDETYQRVWISSKRYLVHRLVMLTFVGPPPENMEVNHKDGIKHNNRWSNLEYVTRLENMRHASDNDLLNMEIFSGSNNGKSKFTEKQVLKIRKAYNNGQTVKDLSLKHDVSYTTIFNIVNRKSWTHV